MRRVPGSNSLLDTWIGRQSLKRQLHLNRHRVMSMFTTQCVTLPIARLAMAHVYQHQNLHYYRLLSCHARGRMLLVPD